MTTLCVVIPFYKRTALVLQALESLSLQAIESNATIDVIIVDSHSVPSLHEVVNHKPYARLSISILNTINSLSAKRNYGARYATSQYIAFLDDDCIPSPGYISSILTAISSSISPGTVFSGQVSFPPACIRSSQYILFRQSLITKFSRVPHTECNFLNAFAMNCVVPKTIFNQLTFNEAFTSYGWEDHDFFLRIHISGIPIINGEFAVSHHEETSVSTYLLKISRYGASLRDVRSINQTLFNLLPFSNYLKLIASLPNLLLLLVRQCCTTILYFLSPALHAIDKLPTFQGSFYLFRLATILAFLSGYCNRCHKNNQSFI